MGCSICCDASATRGGHTLPQTDSVLTRQDPPYSLPKRRKPHALTFRRLEHGVPITGRDRIASLPKQDNSDGKMQRQFLDLARAGARSVRLEPARSVSEQAGLPACHPYVPPLSAPVTVRPCPSVANLEPGEERRASVAEQRSSPRSGGGEQRSLSLARSGPGYDGQADGRRVLVDKRASPPCHQSLSSEGGVPHVAPFPAKGATCGTFARIGRARKDLTSCRQFQTLACKVADKFMGVPHVAPFGGFEHAPVGGLQ